MKVMLQRAEDALFLSSRTFATKSAHSDGVLQAQYDLAVAMRDIGSRVKREVQTAA
jgi:hypothetical protein